MFSFFGAAIEMIKDLMSYDVQEQLLSSLVTALVPVKDKLLKRPEILDGEKYTLPHPSFYKLDKSNFLVQLEL